MSFTPAFPPFISGEWNAIHRMRTFVAEKMTFICLRWIDATRTSNDKLQPVACGKPGMHDCRRSGHADRRWKITASGPLTSEIQNNPPAISGGRVCSSSGGWKVPAKEILANGCNLDHKNPNARDDIAHLPSAELVASILEKEKRIGEIVGRIQKLLRL